MVRGMVGGRRARRPTQDRRGTHGCVRHQGGRDLRDRLPPPRLRRISDDPRSHGVPRFEAKDECADRGASRGSASRRSRQRGGSRALAYAIQFETTLRQWDVIGEWVPLSDPRPSAVSGLWREVDRPTWQQIDAGMVLRVTPGKTEDTSEARVAFDLRECPMIVEEIERIEPTRRIGPLIVAEHTGLPYRHETFRRAWRRDAQVAGIPRNVWNRDLRAGGVTEAREAGASTDDVAKTAGHTDKRTTARVYDRAALEAARRVSRARVGNRHKNEPGT